MNKENKFDLSKLAGGLAGALGGINMNNLAWYDMFNAQMPTTGSFEQNVTNWAKQALFQIALRSEENKVLTHYGFNMQIAKSEGNDDLREIKEDDILDLFDDINKELIKLNLGIKLIYKTTRNEDMCIFVSSDSLIIFDIDDVNLLINIITINYNLNSKVEEILLKFKIKDK